MRKLLLILLLVFMLAGCAGLKEIKNHEVWDHNALYVSWDHMRFSLYGYKQANIKDAIQSGQEGWWGEKICVEKGK
jgi:uncharacterized protein YcfL